ncbi:MAG: sigma-70 family RNA polymerase sigma factor [Phycisphaerales bacterium]|nr:sigma-70 family RNA polymerase sigma factor [Phycisphaerales bacterium]MCI0676313.1 sigma-70 family RNA polymerase sigma factor [Phycisphaerales bacterium]
MASETRIQFAENDACRWLDEHGDYLFGFAMKRIQNAHAAEDLVQETLLAAMTAQGSFEARSAVRSWLIGILKHKIADHIRAKTRETSAMGPTYEPEPISDETLATWVENQFSVRGKWKLRPAKWSDDPKSEAERGELAKVLTDCLDKLPSQAAETFILSESQGHSAESLSKVFDLSTTDIGVILYRARMALRRCLEVSWFGLRRRMD